MTAASTENLTFTKYRTHILAGVFAVIALYFVEVWLIDNVLLKGRKETIIRDGKKISQAADKKLAKIKAVAGRAGYVEELLSQSLPADSELARSLYQAWLVSLVVDSIKLDNPSVSPGEVVARRELKGWTLSFSVRGQGTLEQLTDFLFIFYRTNLRHQVRSLNVTPLRGGEKLDLSIYIEALALSNQAADTLEKIALFEDVGRARKLADLDRIRKSLKAEAENNKPVDSGADYQQTIFQEFAQRAQQESFRLVSLDYNDYHNPITQRNLFSIGGNPDATDYAYLTTIRSVNGEPQALFTLRATDETLKLGIGDSFQIGQFSGTITEIEGPDVVIESEGDNLQKERWLLTLGESLTEAFALPPEF